MKKLTKSPLSFICAMSILVTFCTRPGIDLPAGSAKGSLAYDAETVELKFAGAFTDQKDEDKPIQAGNSDLRLPWHRVVPRLRTKAACGVEPERYPCCRPTHFC